MIVALTGTPGTGKTTIAHALKKQHVPVVDLKRIAETYGFIASYDADRKSSILDLKAIEQYIIKEFTSEKDFVIESHLAHYLHIVDQNIVLRCHPTILRKRLLKRDWSWKKIKENLEAEMLDIILCESIEKHGLEHVFELDTSSLTVIQCAKEIKQILYHKPTTHIVKPGSFDWSELLFDTSIMEGKPGGT